MKGSSLAGKTIDSPIELFDAGPTLTDVAGGKIDYPHFARSLAPLLQDPKAEHRQFSLRPRLKAGQSGLAHDSWVKCDQVTTIEISTAVYPALGAVDRETMKRIEGAIRVALELPEKT